MHKMTFKSLTSMLMFSLLAVTILLPAASAQTNAPLQANANGIAWGIGTPNETAVIDLYVHNYYLDAARNHVISPWVLQFDFAGDIRSIENAVITDKQGIRYTIKGTTDIDIAYGESIHLRLETTLAGQEHALFDNITLRPEVIAPTWRWLGTYQVNDIVEYNGHYYKAIQAHTAYAENWTPVLAPALWQETTDIQTYSYSTSATAELTIIKEWEWLGTYAAGQIVFYNGQFFMCIQPHTAYAPNWTPGPHTASLWKPIPAPI